MDVSCSLSLSNVLSGGEVVGCRAVKRPNLTSRLKYRPFRRNILGDSRLFSLKISPTKLKTNNTFCVGSANCRTLNEGNLCRWYISSSCTSLYHSGNLVKISKHVGLSRCSGSESVAYLSGNGRDAEIIEMAENTTSLESNTFGETGEDGGVEAPNLDELKESLQKALKDLEVARLCSAIFEEKAQKISETAIALKDDAAKAWNDVNIALGNIQNSINEETVAKEVVEKATLALSLTEERLKVAVDSLKIAEEKDGFPKASKESDSEYDSGGEESSVEVALLAAQQDVKECQEHLEDCKADLRKVQSRKEELQKEVDRLNVVAEQAHIKASKAEEDVANIMLLAEQAVANELEAAQRVDDADIALRRAEKNLEFSSIETVDSATEGVIAAEVSKGSADWEGPGEISELVEPLLDGQPEQSSMLDESGKENGKSSVELLKDNDADEEKLKSIQNKIQEMQKESTKDISPLSAPKPLLKKSSRFFSASFFSFTADEEEFTPGSVFRGIVESARKQLPKLVFGSLLVGAGYAPAPSVEE